jgi:uncharacterized protein (DUF488 family)
MSERIVYLAGYSGRQPSWLLAAAVSLDATVFDIRYSPRSRRPEWSKTNLQRVLGGHYLWLPAWGNPHYRGTEAALDDPEGGLAIFDAQDRNAIALCVCANPETCHRRLIRDLLLRERGIKAVELDDALAELEARQMALFGEEPR